MHLAIIIGTVRSLIVDVAMGQIPRSTERISSLLMKLNGSKLKTILSMFFKSKYKNDKMLSYRRETALQDAL